MNIIQAAEALRHQQGRLYSAIDALEECKSEVFRVTANISDKCGKSSVHTNNRELALVRYITAKDCLEKCVAQYVESFRIFNSAMNAMDNPDYMNIIYCRHFSRMTWNQTAAEVGLSPRMVQLKYKEIVRYLSVNASKSETTAKPL